MKGASHDKYPCEDLWLGGECSEDLRGQTEARLRDGPETPPRETKHFSSILETLGGLQKERQGDQALVCVFRSLHDRRMAQLGKVSAWQA